MRIRSRNHGFGCKGGVDEEVISFTDRAAENVLIALNDRDYETYKQDMHDEMLAVVNEQYFTGFSTYLIDTIGDYRQGSKEYLDSYIKNDFYVVIYKADYTEEAEKVQVTAVVPVTDEGIYQIAGFWFDSAKLRETVYEETENE